MAGPRQRRAKGRTLTATGPRSQRCCGRPTRLLRGVTGDTPASRQKRRFRDTQPGCPSSPPFAFTDPVTQQQSREAEAGPVLPAPRPSLKEGPKAGKRLDVET